ncbi:MAG: hypothetical protein H0U74_05830 [Bradymonadaceae bacterium]|nr:hypothetical protein [Lujinxingiaceae bacterium]
MNRVNFCRFPFYLVVVALLLLAFGCADSTVNSNVKTGPRVDDEQDGVLRPSDEYLLVPAGERERTINVSENVALKVFLVHRETGSPAVDQPVGFEILEGAESNGTLGARNSTTGDDGEGQIIFRAGSEAGTVKVRARHSSSNAVDFTLHVQPLATGHLKVKLTNTAPTIMRLQDIDVRLYRNDEFTCDDFFPLINLHPQALAERQAAYAGDSVTFESLGTLPHFVVTAVARGDRGQIAAGSCYDRIRMDADRTVEVELLLQLIPLNPVGRYDVLSHWDFTDALADSGSVGAIVVRVLNVFDNPGLAIYNEIINLVRAAVGGIISGTLSTFLNWTNLDTAFQNMINNFIENNAVLRKLRDAGRDLRDVVANLEVHSELTIGKLSSNYEFRGTDNWVGITLYWRWNCDDTSPPDCGAIRLVPDANGQFGTLGLLSSDWGGRVVAYNQLQIDRHSVSLRYGNLIIYILNQVILPGLTDGNAHSMSEAFAYWIGCDRLANSIIPNGEVCALSVCIRASQIEGFCSTAVSTLFGFADLLVRGLEFDMGLHLGGSGKLIETTSDGFVDLIENGLFEGIIQNADGQSSSPFAATWQGERIDFNINP